MATTRSDLQIVIKAKDEASSAFKGLGSSLATLGKVAAAGIGVATVAAVAFGKSSVTSFNESQKVAAQLDAVLKSTGGSARVTRDAALSLASALQKETTFSDEAVLSAENMLLTFTNIKDNVFPDATKTVLDMSTALGQDTKASAIQLGKALNDPILGVSALRRVGVNFTEDQKKQIETLVKSGKTMEAQKLILRELATEFGGSAAAQAQTFAGKMEQLKNTFDDFKEVVGGMIVAQLTPFLAKMTEIATNLPAMFETARARAVGAYEAIRAAGEAFFSDTNMYWVFIKDFFIPIWEQVRDTLVNAWKTIVEAIQPIKPELEMLAKFFGVIIVGAIMILVKAIASIIVIVAKVVSSLIQAFSGAVRVVEGLFEALFSFILGDNANAVKALKKAWEGFIDFLKGIGKAIAGIFSGAFEPVIKQIEKLRDKWNDLKGKIKSGDGDKRAVGGSVMKNKPYLVGEHGPEMFIPSGSGRIENSPSGGGGSTSIFNFDFSNANIVDRDLFMRDIKRAISREQELRQIGAV